MIKNLTRKFKLNGNVQVCLRKTFVFLVACCSIYPLSAFDLQNFQSELEEIAEKNDLEGFQKYMVEAMDYFSNAVPHGSLDQQAIIGFLDYLEEGSNVESTAWNLYPRLLRIITAFNNKGLGEENPSFSAAYRYADVLSEKTNQHLLKAFEAVKKIPLSQSDINPKYYSAVGFTAEQEETYNQRHQYLLLEEEQLSALQEVLNELKEPVANCIGTPWRVLNIRSWKTYPDPLQHDPNGGWHADGMYPLIYKIMIYPKGCDKYKGTTQFSPDIFHEGPAGSWLLFKNSAIVHRTWAPLLQEGAEDRLIIEVTLTTSLEYDLRPFCAGTLAMHPKLPWWNFWDNQPPVLHTNGCGLNIGSGRDWHSYGWISLEKSGQTGNKYLLSPNCRFPLADGSISTIYSSHVFEHLDDATVARVLSESKRVLNDDGYIIIKIPEFDDALAAWKSRDEGFFRGRVWDFPTNLFPNLGVEDSIDTRAAFLFGSFATPELNGLFSGCEHLDDPKAYFGPPPMKSSELYDLIQTRTPHEIAFELRKFTLQSQGGMPDFGHQNAWGKEELREVLDYFGFQEITFDKEEIMKRWGHISWMGEGWAYSTFCMAKKK